MSDLRDALTRVFHDSRYQVGVDLHEPESGYRECERFADDAIFFGAERLLTAALLDEGLLATALEGYEIVPGDWDQSLDHAWAEAEAALPEPGHVSLTGPFGRERVNFHAAAYSDRTERVENATADIAPYGARLTVNGGAAEFSVWLGAGNGPTPTAALQALAAKLRETP